MENKNKLSIKSSVIRSLMESQEPMFYLAPDVVGSINNAYPDKGKKRFVVYFNTVDSVPMKLVVPFQTYSNWSSTNKDGGMLKFVSSFFDGVRPCGEEDSGMIDEMVDEFGNIYDDSDDKPANIKGAPGYDNKKSGQQATKQYISRYTRVVSPLGYGGVVW